MDTTPSLATSNQSKEQQWQRASLTKWSIVAAPIPTCANREKVLLCLDAVVFQAEMDGTILLDDCVCRQRFRTTKSDFIGNAESSRATIIRLPSHEKKLPSCDHANHAFKKGDGQTTNAVATTDSTERVPKAETWRKAAPTIAIRPRLAKKSLAMTTSPHIYRAKHIALAW